MSSRRYNNIHTTHLTSDDCEIKYGKFINITADKIACDDFSADNIGCINLTAHNIATDNLYSENSLLDNTYLKNVYSNPINTSISIFDDINMNSNYINDISLTTDATDPPYYVKYNLTTKQMSYKIESGPPGSTKKYGQFISKVTQTCASGTVLALSHEVTIISDGPYIQTSPAVNNDRIRFNKIGTYKIGTSIQFYRDANKHYALFWFAKNGNFIPDSSSSVILESPSSKVLAYAEIIENITSLNDYIQIYISGINENIMQYSKTIAYSYNPNPDGGTLGIPFVPSVITTVIEI